MASYSIANIAVSSLNLWLFVAQWFGIQMTQATPVTPALTSLGNHFYIDGCASSPYNLTAELDLQQLKAEGTHAICLKIYGPDTPRLKTDMFCELPSNDLYRLTFQVHNQLAQIQYEALSASKKNKLKGNCTLSIKQPIIILEGYGFVSCRDPQDMKAIKAAIGNWEKFVDKEEEMNRYVNKRRIMGGIAGGVAAIIIGCIICVVLRLRATKRQPPRSTRRANTPARSAQNRIITSDQTSGTQQSLMSSGRN